MSRSWVRSIRICKQQTGSFGTSLTVGCWRTVCNFGLLATQGQTGLSSTRGSNRYSFSAIPHLMCLGTAQSLCPLLQRAYRTGATIEPKQTLCISAPSCCPLQILGDPKTCDKASYCAGQGFTCAHRLLYSVHSLDWEGSYASTSAPTAPYEGPGDSLDIS